MSEYQRWLALGTSLCWLIASFWFIYKGQDLDWAIAITLANLCLWCETNAGKR